MTAAAKTILVVDDDAELRELVGDLLSREGFDVVRAETVKDAQQILEETRLDLMVLDLMLPDQDGLTFCRSLRARDIALPVIMLTAKGDDFDRVLGFDMGADDYLPKPFHSRELVARIKAVLRRSGGGDQPAAPAEDRFVRFEGWTLDHAKRELIDKDGVVVLLSGAEYELLSAFLHWPQLILSREKLLDATRGSSSVISDRSIDIQVSRLRKKLGDDPKSPRIIKTMWGDGYIFTPDIRR